MRIAVLAETDKSEPRVAATPETVKKFIGLGAEIAVQAGAGRASGFSDADYAAAGAKIGASARRDGDRGGRDPARAPSLGRRNQRREKRRGGGRHPRSFRPRIRPQGTGRRRRDGFRDGAHAAHHPRAVDGRAVLAGQYRRLSRRHRRRRRIWPRPPDDDDAGRHGSGGARLYHGRRRGGTAGHRHRAPARRDRHGDRRASGHQGAGRVARREVHRGRKRRIQTGRDLGRLRQGNVRRISSRAGGTGRRPYRQAGHRDHDRADPGPSGAQARFGRAGSHDARRFGDRRSRRRARRQLRIDQARRDGRGRRREDCRRLQSRGTVGVNGVQPSTPKTYWPSSRR